jgi:rubrerythrin
LVKAMTELNLMSAFSGESQAQMRYLIFAKRAAESGFPNISRLFTAVSHAEKIHASNHYRNIVTKGSQNTFSGTLFGSRSTVEDLQHGIDGENHEVNEMYPAYIAVAKDQKEYGAEVTFRYAWEAEKTHADLYARAKTYAEQKKDADLKQIGVCEICGWTFEGDVPDQCPICKAKKDKFTLFSI